MSPSCVTPGRAHPRSRGEHDACCCGGRSDQGSSPLTRGAQTLGAGAAVAVGLIPAHAGSTVEVLVVDGWFGAHPRSRGEHPPRTAGEVTVHNKEGQLVAQDDVTPLTRGGESIA